MYTAVRFQSLGTELRVHGCVRIRLLGYFGPMGISSWRVIPSFLPMLNLELNQIGLSEPVRYSWLGQKSPRPSLEGCGGRVSLFFLRPPGRARKRSELSKGLRALRGWESTPPSRSDFGRDAYARDDGRRPRRRASRLAVCVHTLGCVCTLDPVCVFTHILSRAHGLGPLAVR